MTWRLGLRHGRIKTPTSEEAAPEDRLDDLSFKIESVKRRWSRGPRWDSTMRRQMVSSPVIELEIAGVTDANRTRWSSIGWISTDRQPRSGDEMDRVNSSGCVTECGATVDCSSLDLWAPPQDILALGPPLLERQLSSWNCGCAASSATRGGSSRWGSTPDDGV